MANREEGKILSTTFDVLVVDDHKIDRQILSNYLKEYDVSFLVAENGAEAIKCLKKKVFKLVILDVEMPEMDGYTLTEVIRKELLINIPIVAVTDSPIEVVKAKCFEIGMNACFSKPISKIELVGMLTMFLPNELFSVKGMETESRRDDYEVIDLSYLRTISLGDAGYEREIAGKFVEMIALEIEQLNTALKNQQIENLKSEAHKLRSTIMVMGLETKLSEHLKAIEYENLSLEQLKNKVKMISAICKKAKEEALKFLSN